MKNKFMVTTANNLKYNTYEEAEKDAKRLTSNGQGQEYAIVQAIAVAKSPVPEIEIVKL